MKFHHLSITLLFAFLLNAEASPPTKDGKFFLVFGLGFENTPVEATTKGELVFHGFLTSMKENGFAAILLLPVKEGRIELVALGGGGSTVIDLTPHSEPYILVERKHP